MEYIHAVIVGIIQGLTEFLPVSSSGHLVLSQHLLGVKMPGLTFEIFLHFGTLISVFWVFRTRIKAILVSLGEVVVPSRRSQDGDSNRWLALLLVVGSVPTGLLGLALANFVEQAFASPGYVGYFLLITGVLLWLADALPGGNKDVKKTGLADAVTIGVFQGLAVFPGISRSGATISGALFRRLDKRTAAEYSFLLSIPAIAGATLLELVSVVKHGNSGHNWLFYGIGVLFSALAGIVAIRVFLRMLVNNRLQYFSYYCWLVGLLAIIFL